MQKQDREIKDKPYVCTLCFKSYQNQTSLSTHKTIVHQMKKKKSYIKSEKQTIKQNRQKNAQLGQNIHKNDVEFHQKAAECQILSEKTLTNIIYPLLQAVFPNEKKLKYGSTDNYGQFAQTVLENIYQIDDLDLPSKQREYCYKHVIELAQKYKLQKILSLTKEIQVCKPHQFYHSQVIMIWDLIKVINLDVAKIIYLDLLCIVVQKQYSQKRLDVGSIKERALKYDEKLKRKIDYFREKAYPNTNKEKLQELQAELDKYVAKWTDIFQNKQNQITKCLRRYPKRAPKQSATTQN